jgi:tetratricopeptide (TPR) repeat protein
LTGAKGDATLATLPGQVMGTLAYMAPEQAAADPDGVDVRADIYALGAIGYELLAGHPPLDLQGKPLPEALRAIMQDEPRKLGALDRRLRGDAETVIATALQKDSARRYASAGALADDLRRVLALQPIAARPATTMYQLRTFARRRKGLVAAGGVIAATLVMASVVSVAFAFSAQRQRDRADRRFAEVRAMANTMLFDLHDKIERLPGSTDARMDLVQTGLRYLDSIAADGDIDPELMGELAEGYFRIGDILGNPRRANLGDAEGAIVSYERSLALRQAMPTTGDTLVKIGLTRLAMGEAMTSTPRVGEAPEHYRAALAGVEGVDSPGADDLRVLVSQRLADILLNQGRPEQAAEYFQSAALAAGRLAADGDPTLERRYSVALNEWARALTQADRHAEAAPHLERSFQIRSAAAAANPGDARAQRDLALVHHRLGDIQSSLGQPERRVEHYAAARDILATLAEQDAQNTRAAYDVFVAESKLAEAFMDSGDLAGARKGFEAALAVTATLTRTHPENQLYQMALATNLERVALSALREGDHAAAHEAYVRAIEQCGVCMGADASDARVWTVLALAQQGLGNTLLERADPDRAAARASLGAAIETLLEMDERGMEPVRSGLDAESIRVTLEALGDGGPAR